MSLKLNRRSFFATLLATPFIAKVNVFTPKKVITLAPYLDNITIWDRALTKEEVIEMYCSTSPVKR
jgi:hypothetical protein